MLAFLKLGGSLITDKESVETPRVDVIVRLAREIRQALDEQPDLSLLLGHGSGSFGHTAAHEYGTRQGVNDLDGWYGFGHVSVVAARLNQIVAEAFDALSVPVLAVRPSSSVICRNGQIVEMAMEPIRHALADGVVPIVHGDVAFDETRGGTIVSTEEVFAYAARALEPDTILLVGDFPGVLDEHGNVISEITPEILDYYRPALHGSAAADVTGGMESKVSTMLDLCKAISGLNVHIFDGQTDGSVVSALRGERIPDGTRLYANELS